MQKSSSIEVQQISKTEKTKNNSVSILYNHSISIPCKNMKIICIRKKTTESTKNEDK